MGPFEGSREKEDIRRGKERIVRGSFRSKLENEGTYFGGLYTARGRGATFRIRKERFGVEKRKENFRRKPAERGKLAKGESLIYLTNHRKIERKESYTGGEGEFKKGL